MSRLLLAFRALVSAVWLCVHGWIGLLLHAALVVEGTCMLPLSHWHKAKVLGLLS